ncbi:diguanylate cyclase (GGDEF) domain-containing protein [Terriglobus roseus DSM 18391]|uniref:diguanylate cyclase n=1 Tax=Terriglobus roseus (strain DSM 18391 / NRRL B-41598 / KBS 63) TaxID=926566 RepID=I3ZLF9_TERRK|nr:diguanylate cyclase [Terriglobus roseus]AFL90077.1 diguanylate cyclase (GGDEF) domain-containing protein [Terriglobus roseus DSM 18391]
MSAETATENELLLQFLYACPVGLVEIEADGAIGMINPLAMQLMVPLMRPPQGMNFFDIMEPYAPELRNLVEEFTALHGEVCSNLRIFISPGTKQSGYLAHVLSCTLVRLAADRFMATLSDVSKVVAQERRLGEAEVWFSSLLDGVSDFAVLSLDAQGLIDGVSASALRQTGFSNEDLLGKTLDVFDSPTPATSAVTVTEQISLACRDGWYLIEGWQKRKDLPADWCQRLIAVRSEEGEEDRTVTGYTVILREVVRQKHDALELKQMLTRDHLTGASNRAHFFEIAGRECSRFVRYGHSLSVVALDIDHFKSVNDTYGHAAGDKVLREVSRRCMVLLRPADTFARVGGEEFMVLLPGTDLRGARLLAERLRSALENMTVSYGNEMITVTGSFGCAEAVPDTSSPAPLMESADRALYNAKQMGRNMVVLAVAGEVPGE